MTNQAISVEEEKIAYYQPWSRIWELPTDSAEIRSELWSSLPGQPSQNYTPITQTRLLSVPDTQMVLFSENRGS